MWLLVSRMSSWYPHRIMMESSSLMNASAAATPLNAVVSSGSNVMLLMIQNPLWYQSRQTISRLFHTYNSKNYHYLLSIRIQRWKQNFARLYARRILEIAIASAAATKYKTQLQERMMADPKPSEWTDWKEGRNWMDDTMNEMGTSKFGRLGMALKRIFHLSLLATPIVVMTPLSYLHDGIRQSMWDYALYAIEQAGPTFIKFVQWATTRQDLFSQEFCTHFGQLRDRTKGHQWDETLRILEQELGPNWKSIIQMETTPIGSGCIAQVYKGTLLEHTPMFAKGTTLAVKVQHPGILHKVCVDFYLLAMMADFLEAIPRLNLDYLSIRDTVDQFCNVMVPQLDLRLESHHLNRFGRDFQNDPQVQFPRPIDELTTPKVLTETFCEGKPILSFHSADMETRKELAYLGLKTTLKMIFLHDFIHGDLHPGNILVSKNDRDQFMLTLLDCGLVIEFGPQQHETVVKILGAFTRRQGRHAAQLMVDTSSKCQANAWDVEMFIKGIEQIIVDDAEQNFVEHIGDYITDICYLACRHKVKLEAAFVNAALAVEIIEGIASSLYPDIQVVSTALPLVMKAELMHRLPLSWLG